ncbi:hypothetical protein [Clostridium grantii]|uniref:Phage protein n=1 Tax=Clostridium grantii DSM 8605 TaxID=1121316 RepID=A0A1M5SMQ4_9CLOT|nr:hypothetical protein [Clostridium grantii]SHH39797.1 hypothetical protein SAMN02745207_01025 [Clostridium grantii DSM 8605]
MANITYIGFDDYSQRYSYEITFNSEFDRIKFQNKFNMNFRGSEVQAEIDKFQVCTEKVVFTDESYKDKIRSIIERMLI